MIESSMCGLERNQILEKAKHFSAFVISDEHIDQWEAKFTEAIQQNLENKRQTEADSIMKVIRKLTPIAEDHEKRLKLIRGAIFIDLALKNKPKALTKQELKCLLKKFVDPKEIGSRGARNKDLQLFIFSYYFDLLFALLPMCEYVPKKKNMKLCQKSGHDALVRISIKEDMRIADLSGTVHEIKKCNADLGCGEKLNENKMRVAGNTKYTAILIQEFLLNSESEEKKYTTMEKIYKHIGYKYNTPTSHIDNAITALLKGNLINQEKNSFMFKYDDLSREAEITAVFWREAANFDYIKSTLISTAPGYGWEIISDRILHKIIDDIQKTLPKDTNDCDTRICNSDPNIYSQDQFINLF